MYKKYLFLILAGFMLLVPIQAPVLAFSAPTKDNVGLNVHWTLGGFGQDNLYNKRLYESKTKWAREHFYTEVFYGDNQAWVYRYEEILKKYKQNGIKVVGMLAYGSEHGNFTSPDPKKWEGFVDYMVRRYGKYVDVWEVWNEPDSPTYLKPNTVDNYLPILEIAYDRIKKLNPSDKVLAAGLASPNVYFAQELYKRTKKFDALSFHIYYCGYRRDQGNYDKLINDLTNLKSVINKNNGGRAWVTEMGCSTGERDINEEFQKKYLDEATRIVMDSGFVERIFIYNIRNYDYINNYENNFGLLDKDMSPREAWNWYKRVPIGPYNQERLSLEIESEKALELKRRLEYYFGKGLIPAGAEHWPKFVSAYIYGGYSVKAIVQAIRFGGQTVHTEIPQYLWKERPEYIEFINKDWTGGVIVFAYNKPRILITEEAQKANELKVSLQADYDYQTLKINSENWGSLVKAYVYGGYSVEAISRAYICNGAIHFEIPFEQWQYRAEYKNCMQ